MSPTSPHTLDRQCVPLRTGSDATDANDGFRQWNAVQAKESAASHIEATCPPCNQSCQQGRACPARPEPDRTPNDDRHRAIFWRAVALIYAAIGAAFLLRWALS